MSCYGIDFGTTNSVVARAGADGTVQSATYRDGERSWPAFRSVLCFWQDDSSGTARTSVCAGPAAIEAFLEHRGSARLVQSIKTLLSSHAFTFTEIFGKRFDATGLVAEILRLLREASEPELGELPPGVVAGRPVLFAGLAPDHDLADRRLRAAFVKAGFRDVRLALEPEAAAYYYTRSLEGIDCILVADLGGGTSDFSVLECRPGAGRTDVRALSHAGIGIAGDTLDYRIVQNVVTPALGRGTSFVSDGKRIEVPRWIYTQFERWHYLSLMNTPQIRHQLLTLEKQAEQREAIHWLRSIIEREMGFELYQVVARTKAELSASPVSTFDFRMPALDAACAPVRLVREIHRSEFEAWIAADVDRIMDTMHRALAEARVIPGRIGRVFMTGGTSLVPLIRARFGEVFEPTRITYGEEFVAVAKGLALLMRDGRAARLP